MNKFLIASTLRSGSGLISDYLNASKVLGLVSNAESFRSKYSDPLLARKAILTRSSEDILQITDFKNPASKDNYGVVVNGSTILNTDYSDQYNAFSKDLIFERLIQKFTLGSFNKVVLISRDNKLEQAINTYYASITGKWMDTSDNSSDEDRTLGLIGINFIRYKNKDPNLQVKPNINDPSIIPKVEYNFMEIYSNLTRIYSEEDNWNAYMKLNNIQFLPVVFEEFLANREAVLASIYSYLGVEIPATFNIAEVKTRKKVINPQLDDFTTRFKADYQTAFGKQYRNSRFTA